MTNSFFFEMPLFHVKAVKIDSTAHIHHVAMSVPASHNIVVNCFFRSRRSAALAQKAEMLSRKANGLRYAEMELNVTPRGKFF